MRNSLFCTSKRKLYAAESLQQQTRPAQSVIAVHFMAARAVVRVRQVVGHRLSYAALVQWYTTTNTDTNTYQYFNSNTNSHANADTNIHECSC